MEFPFVIELLDYWQKEPPEHILLKMFTGYQGREGGMSAEDQRRRRRAEEVGDTSYRPPAPPSKPDGAKVVQEMGAKINNKAFAPGHIKEAIDRAKRNEQMNVPGVPN